MDKKQYIVINACFGGFSLSRKAFHLLRQMKNKTALKEPDWGEPWFNGGIRDTYYEGFCRDIPRDDPDLITVLVLLGKQANGRAATLKLVTIPADVEWVIQEYDGYESIHEKHRTWG